MTEPCFTPEQEARIVEIIHGILIGIEREKSGGRQAHIHGNIAWAAYRMGIKEPKGPFTEGPSDD